MDQNNKKNGRGDKDGGGSWRGVVSLVCWALFLTIIISYAGTYMNSAGHQASSVIVEYSDGRLPEMTERARNLLMPEKLFRRAYEEKKSCGPLRPTLLAVTFQVPLAEVFNRIVELGLYGT